MKGTAVASHILKKIMKGTAVARHILKKIGVDARTAGKYEWNIQNFRASAFGAGVEITSLWVGHSEKCGGVHLFMAQR